jgi:amidohydrolase
MVRADIDALPIQETNDVPYKSKVDGVKHACGHDAHTAIGLGTAELLWKRRGDLNGTVHVIFQPAEEGPPPGEKGGAPLMIEEGLLDRLKPEAIFGLHSMPNHRVGTVSWTPGATMASSDTFRITITGKQSHGAEPHRGIDPIVIGSQMVLALQTIASRRVDPLEPVVVTVGVFRSGTRHNIVPDSAVLEGTLRTLSPEVRTQARNLIETIATGVAQTAGGTAAIIYLDNPPNPPVINDAALGAFAERSLKKTLGESNVVRDPPRMVAEDFAHFAERVPSFFYFLGVGNPDKGITANLHTAAFDIDEDALVIGATAMTNLVLDYLE